MCSLHGGEHIASMTGVAAPTALTISPDHVDRTAGFYEVNINDNLKGEKEAG